MKQIINKKKDEYMQLEKKKFTQDNNRQKIQTLIDIDTFKL